MKHATNQAQADATDTAVMEAAIALGGENVMPVRIFERAGIGRSTLTRSLFRLEQAGRITRGVAGSVSLVSDQDGAGPQAPAMGGAFEAAYKANPRSPDVPRETRPPSFLEGLTRELADEESEKEPIRHSGMHGLVPNADDEPGFTRKDLARRLAEIEEQIEALQAEGAAIVERLARSG